MDSLYDVFRNIRDDEGEHVKTMVACQDMSVVMQIDQKRKLVRPKEVSSLIGRRSLVPGVLVHRPCGAWGHALMSTLSLPARSWTSLPSPRSRRASLNPSTCSFDPLPAGVFPVLLSSKGFLTPLICESRLPVLACRSGSYLATLTSCHSSVHTTEMST